MTLAMQAFATFMSVLSIDSNHVPSLCSIGEIYKAKAMLQVRVHGCEYALFLGKTYIANQACGLCA